MAENNMRIPSGQGGLTRYSEEVKSLIAFTPGHVVVFCVVVLILIIILHYLA